MKTQEVQDWQVFEAMRVFGGSFMQSIGCAGRYADSNNVEKIKAAWPDEWARYKKMARKKYGQ